jgi:PAS domain-containing protein
VKTRIRNMLAVRLLFRRLETHNRLLEQTVQLRTAELRESEARYRSLTELASDWYWGAGRQRCVHQGERPRAGDAGAERGHAGRYARKQSGRWLERGRAELAAQHHRGARAFSRLRLQRTRRDGSVLQYRVSGEPMFNQACRFVGYRGVGIEITSGPPRGR